MISSLLHFVGLRPRVYYTLTNFRGGGGKALLPPPQYVNDMNVKQLVHVAYRDMFQHQEQHAWIRHIKDLLCCHGFGNIWNDQSVMNEKVILATFE